MLRLRVMIGAFILSMAMFAACLMINYDKWFTMANCEANLWVDVEGSPWWRDWDGFCRLQAHPLRCCSSCRFVQDETDLRRSARPYSWSSRYYASFLTSRFTYLHTCEILVMVREDLARIPGSRTKLGTTFTRGPWELCCLQASRWREHRRR